MYRNSKLFMANTDKCLTSNFELQSKQLVLQIGTNVEYISFYEYKIVQILTINIFYRK